MKRRSLISMLYMPARSLSSKLSLVITLLAIPIFVLSLGLLFVQSRKNIKEEATERANGMLYATMQQVCRHLSTVETATNTNEWLILEYLQPDSLLALTRRIVQINPHIDGCSISAEPYTFTKFGSHFSAYSVREADSVSTVIEEEYNYFEKIWYKKPHVLGHPCWVSYRDEVDSLELTLDGVIASYSKPIYDADNRFIAVISTDLSFLRLSKVITAEKPYPNSYFMMLGEDGSYFIHPDSTQLFNKTIFSNADPRKNADIIALGHEMTAGNKGSMSVMIDEVPCQVCYQPVPGTPWSLALVCPDSDILHNYHKLSSILFPLLLIGFMIIIILSNRAVAHAIKPLNQLLAKTQSIASGNYEVHIPKSQRVDAVGRLQNSFASMLQWLNFHMGSIRYTAEQAGHRNEELAKATRLAEEADKKKTTFIQNVTHQIRTPLNIIMGFSQVLRDYVTLPGSSASSHMELSDDEMKSITDSMNHNSKLLNRIVLMLFDSSDIGLSKELSRDRIDTVFCNEVSKEAISYIKLHYSNTNINFCSDVPDDFSIQTNHLNLMRSLREILYNSAKHSDGQHISLHVVLTETTVRFIVEDTGKGISEADRDLMFEPFTKLDDLSEGLGLGLPLAKRHMCNLGGNLILDADYHEGCRFILELPRTA